jgi:tetratricopeptide (TPR) repeat protein
VIEESMRQGRWSDVGLLLSATKELPLGVVESAWMTLFRSSLAWAENRRDLALKRLRSVYDHHEDPAVREEVAARLEQWLGFAGDIRSAPAEYAADLLWWARHRKLPVIEAEALRTLGEEAIGQERFADARALILEFQTVSAQLEDQSSSALACELLGKLALILGPVPDAGPHFRRAMELYESAGHPEDHARAQMWAGWAMFCLGNRDDARTLCDQAAEAQTKLEARSGLAHTLLTSGFVRFAAFAEYDMAQELLGKAHELYRELGDHAGEVHALSLRIDIEFELAMDEPASHVLAGSAFGDLCVEAAGLYKKTEDRLGAARIQFLLGTLAGMRAYEAAAVPGLAALHRGRQPDRMDRMVAHCQQARDLYLAAGDRLSYAHTQTALGAALMTMWKRYDWAEGEAYHALKQALEIYQEANDPFGEGGVHLILGQVALGNLEYKEARERLFQAMERFKALGFSTLVETTTALLARAVAESGPPDSHQSRVLFIWRSRRLSPAGWHFVERFESRRVLNILDVQDENATAAAWRQHGGLKTYGGN